jgi:hypothetical protein
MKMLTFEFPTAGSAAEFFARVRGVAKLSHRVVDVQHADDVAAAKELARKLGGRLS